MTSQLKTFMLLALLSGLIIVLGGALGGKTGIVIAFGLALIMNVGSYWYSDKIVLRMYQARELSESEAPMIYQMVRQLADLGLMEDKRFDAQIELLRQGNRMDCVAFLMERRHRSGAQADEAGGQDAPASLRSKFAL